MLYKRYSTSTTYVFTRWSRKAWALFSAIGKQIKIGAIALKLGDMAHKRKQFSGAIISTYYSIFCNLFAHAFEFDSSQPKPLINPILKCSKNQLIIDTLYNNKFNSKLNRRCCM